MLRYRQGCHCLGDVLLSVYTALLILKPGKLAESVRICCAGAATVQCLFQDFLQGIEDAGDPGECATMLASLG